MSETHNHHSQYNNTLPPIQFVQGSKQGRSGINILEAFLLLFVAFKLAHIIKWSWIFVLAPGWLPVAAAILSALFGKALRSIINKRLRNHW